MKKNLTILFALGLLLIAGLGCGYLDGVTSGGSSNTAANAPANSADPNAMAKTGVAECDELIDILNQSQNNPEDNFLTRKGKELLAEEIKAQIKRNIEENQRDKQRIAQVCREISIEYNRQNLSNANRNAAQ